MLGDPNVRPRPTVAPARSRGWPVVALAAGCLLACPREGAPPPRNQLVLGTRTEPRTLDPAFVRLAGAQEIARLAFRDLVDFDDQWALRPQLAASVPTAETSSTGGFVVDWRLRPGLEWSDGRPLTSKDVVFGHRIEADDQLAAVNHDDAQLVARMQVIDAQRLRVFWRAPFSGYRAPRVHAVLPRHAYPEPGAGELFSGMTTPEPSSGPFRVAAWTRGEQLILTRNPHWLGPRPALERIVFRFLQSEDALEAELLAGTIDAVGEAGGLSPGRARSLGQRLAKTHDVVLTDSAVRLGIECRADHPIVGQLRVRRALSAVVDRQVFGEVAYGGAARPAGGLFPPRHPAFIAPSAEDDREAARAELARWKGQPPVALQFAADSEPARRAAVFLQNVWSRAGFPVVLDGKPFSVLLQLLADREHGPLVLLALRMRPDWDARSVLASAGRQNYGGYASAEVDAWIAAARQASDAAAWGRVLRRVEQRYQRDLPSIPLVYRRTVSIKPKALRGWRPTGTTTPVTWNAEQWRWSQPVASAE